MKKVFNFKKVLAILSIMFVLFILIFVSFIASLNVKSEKTLKNKYGITDEKISVGIPLSQYTEITKLNIDDNLNFGVTSLSKCVKGSFLYGKYFLYTVENSDDVLGNIYAAEDYYDINSMSRIFFKDADKIPLSANYKAVSYVSLSATQFDFKKLTLSDEQIKKLHEMFFDDANKESFIQMEMNDDNINWFRVNFHVKGVEGLYYVPSWSFGIFKNKDDGKFYLEDNGKYLMLPDDLQLEFDKVV